MQLVLLAAGHGRRFGGLKQLAPVGPAGEAIMDYTARSAAASGMGSVVVVVREEIREEIARHVRRRWPVELSVELACQAPVPGTAQAVLSARPYVSGPFAVANADDLYGQQAFAALVGGPESAAGEPPHLLVAYQLARTILTDGAVTRGLCEVDEACLLRTIVEHTVQRHEDGSFFAHPLGRPGQPRSLTGAERVSMNLWGFAPRLFDHLEEALTSFDPRRAPRPELLLPDVVNDLVHRGADQVQVVDTSAPCLGVTHQEDLSLVRAQLAGEPVEPGPVPLSRPG